MDRVKVDTEQNLLVNYDSDPGFYLVQDFQMNLRLPTVA